MDVCNCIVRRIYAKLSNIKIRSTLRAGRLLALPMDLQANNYRLDHKVHPQVARTVAYFQAEQDERAQGWDSEEPQLKPLALAQKALAHS